MSHIELHKNSTRSITLNDKLILTQRRVDENGFLMVYANQVHFSVYAKTWVKSTKISFKGLSSGLNVIGVVYPDTFALIHNNMELRVK